jgi:carbon storage regulator
MLVLSRTVDERIFIGDDIRIMVVEIRGDKVRLGIEAPVDVIVDREEVREKRIAGQSKGRLNDDK